MADPIFRQDFEGDERAIIALFAETFTASEGMEEGARIGRLVDDLLCGTPAGDIHVFTAWQGGLPVGGAIFTRLDFADDPRRVVLLSPMAVATDWQDRGIGQALINHALNGLRKAGMDVALTYGDPAFYGRTGFRPLSEATVPPPLPLSQPEGWIGQSLSPAPLTPFTGPATCVTALDDPALW